MSAKPRSLRKKLKQKEESEQEQEPANQSNPAAGLKTASTFQETKKNPMLFKAAPKRRRDSYIDPLEYFQKEHLIIKEEKMDDYAVDEDQVIPEEGKKDDRPKPKGGMMMMGMPMPMGGPKGGMGFKINFEEMMKARSKIKKEPAGASTQRPSSVKSRKMLDQKEDDEEGDNDDEPKKRGANDEQNLYIKLVMARNKYTELSSAKTNVYDKIMKQIKEFREIKDLPPKYMEKVDEFESKLKIPDRLILDPDVQEIENDNYEKVVENPVNLEEIINSLNLSKN
jgi:hypothetical protein